MIAAARLARPLAVALLSAATLAYEILLVRVFAIEYFHHFASMAIGVAMLGFGASGTLVALRGPLDGEGRERWFAAALPATALALVASPALTHLVPLDPTRLAWDPGEWPRLALVYLTLALPFGLGALGILLALTLAADRPGRLYGASFGGAALGALVALGALWVAAPTRALAIPAVVAAAGALCTVRGASTAVRTLTAGAALASAAAVAHPPWRRTITPYNGQPQAEAYPAARRVAEGTSPVGWVVAVDAPAFRYAPGLSLAYRGTFPRQTGVFLDGETVGAATAWEDRLQAGFLLDGLPSAAPYALGMPGRALVLGTGGGLEVDNALSHGVGRVTVVEPSPDVVDIARTLSTIPGRIRARIEWVVGDGRTYVARAGRRRFEMISIGPGGGPGTSAAGVHALGEDFLHTVDAYEAYLRRLNVQGTLAITRWMSVPPREPVRVILTATAALRRIHPLSPSLGLVALRTWGTVTVLAKPSGFSDLDIRDLKDWAVQRGFDIDWYPGATAPEARFNLLERPTLFEAARAGAAGPDSAARFAATYPFSVAPVGDARPYPHHFVRLGSLRALLGAGRGSWLPFAEWGPVALVATLCQSAVLAGFLLLLPALRRGSARGPETPRLVVYFGAIGVAYLSAEVAALQQLGLLLGHPVYAVAAVLATLLACSGLGSAWSDRLDAGRARVVALVLAGVLLVLAAALLGLVHVLQKTPLLLRAGAAAVVLAPLGALMGMPFPLGLRALASPNAHRTAWAWAANGFASVVAVPLAALVALEAGSPVLFLLAAGAYGLAATFSVNHG